jgi:hypothetical protein
MRDMGRIVTLVAAVALSTVALTAQNVPHVGTWRMNLAKSKFDPGPAPASQTREYVILSDARGYAYDMLQATQTNLLPDGTTSVGTYAARFDGMDYPAKGSTVYDSIALTRVDANTFDAVLKRSGKVVQTARNTVSADGKTMTVTVNASDLTTARKFVTVIVLDRQ